MFYKPVKVTMNQKITHIIEQEFPEDQQAKVIQALSSIELHHVMAASAYNLENTRLAILKLAKGDVKEVVDLTEKAKIDFRDVIMWATLDN